MKCAQYTLDATIDIGVCTFQRPALREVLTSLFAITIPNGMRIRVIVADNDSQPSAKPLVDELRVSSPHEICYVHCPKANISIARNACLGNNRAAYLAFIDDDEIASTDWLIELYSTLRETGADAVLGPVRAVYNRNAPDWLRQGDFHSTFPVWVQGEIRTGYTCNVILNMRSPQIAQRRFDLALGQSGGEDTQFFTSVTDNGGRIAFAPAAVLEEPVPAHRASFKWLFKRRFRFGQTHGRIAAEKHSGARRWIEAVLAASKVGYCCFCCLMMMLSAVNRNRYALRAALHAGAVSGIFGVREIRQYGTVELS